MRACCLSKSFTYADLLKAIQQLFGRRILPSVDTIRCSLSRDDTLRLPINNDEDLKQILMIAKTTGTTKLNFIITKNPVRTVSRLISVNSEDDADSICNDQETLSEPNNTGLDSPPPGTIVRPKPRRMSRSAVPNEGGRFIPESVSTPCWTFSIDECDRFAFVEWSDLCKWQFCCSQPRIE